MTTVTIEPGAKEPIRVLITDSLRAPITGLSNIKLRVQRSNDEFLDWSDDTFKAGAAVVDMLQALVPVDNTYNPGWYKLNKAGHVNGLDTSTFTNAVDGVETYTLTTDQDGTPQSAANTPQVGELVARPQGYVVMQGYSYEPNLDSLSGNIWVEHNNIIVPAPTACSVDWRDRDGTLLFTVADAAPDAQGFFEVVQATPGIIADTLYYAEASITIPRVGTVKGGKASFTFGA